MTMQQAYAVLNAIDQGYAETCIKYMEATHPEYNEQQLKESVGAMMELVGVKDETIEYWLEYFFKS